MLNIKKILAFGFVCLLVFNVASMISLARPYILKTNSSISLSSDNNTLSNVMPISGFATKTIEIKYEYNKFARPIGFPLPNRKNPTTISLSVENKPNWCEITLDNYSFNAPIGSFLKKGTVYFNTTLNATITQNSVTAFSEGGIVLNATSKKNGNIVASSTLYELTISPGFIPMIDYSIFNKSIILRSGEEKNISLFVKNEGNSKIIVEINANMSKNNTLGLGITSPITLDMDEEKIIPISLKATSLKNDESKNVSIEMTLQYHSINAPNTIFSTINNPISFNVLINYDSDVVDLTPFVIGIAIVFVILYFIFTIIVWRR